MVLSREYTGFVSSSVGGVAVVRGGAFSTNKPLDRRARRTSCVARRSGRCRMDASPASPPPAPDSKKLSAAARELRSLLRKCPLYFVGCMGCGKSSVARYVAYELGYRFLDTDELVELAGGASIPQIFAESGESAFRDLETAVLGQVQAYTSTCVATGGGIVMRNENWAHLQTGIVVWLDAPPSVLARRLNADTTRPLLAKCQTVEEKEQALAEILEARRSKYEQADVVVPVSEEQAVDHIADDLIRRVSNFIKENPPRFSEKGKELYPEDTPRPPPPPAGG